MIQLRCHSLVAIKVDVSVIIFNNSKTNSFFKTESGEDASVKASAIVYSRTNHSIPLHGLTFEAITT